MVASTYVIHSGTDVAVDDSIVRLGFDNPFARGQVSASSVANASRHNAARAVDWKTATQWKASTGGIQYLRSEDVPAGGPFDYFAVARHNLAGSPVIFQVREPGGAWQNASAEVVAPPGPFMVLFASAVGPDAQLYIADKDEPAEIGVFSAGAVTEFPEGAQPPFAPGRLNPDDEIIGGMTDGGEIVGASLIRTGGQERLSIDLLHPDWVRDVWHPIRRALRTQGVFLAWNHENYQADVIYGFLADAKARHSGTFFMDLDITIKGVIE